VLEGILTSTCKESRTLGSMSETIIVVIEHDDQQVGQGTKAVD
jgi:hypothetical protein